MSGISRAYIANTSESGLLAKEARTLFPGGVTLDTRRSDPYPVYMVRASGPYKWDVDGNRYIDYVCGNGALLLGNSHPAVMAAISAQLANGTHLAASSPLEVKWAQTIRRMMPSAERVRFTSSGTEASMLAFRLARAFTGRKKIVRFRGHFHGWQDHATSGLVNHFDGTPTPGVLQEVMDNVVLLTANDAAALEAVLATAEIAAVFLEPTGGGFGKLPVDADFARAARSLTQRHDTLLVFDEVVTGFRVARGGAQSLLGIVPDLTLLAKILGGGLPGAAVCGRAEILDLMDWDATAERKVEKMPHQGTFNAFPLSAAAGITTLELVESTDAIARATNYTAQLCVELNRVLEDEKVAWAVYQSHSGFQFFMNPSAIPITPTKFDVSDVTWDDLNWNAPQLSQQLRIAMLLNGVELTNRPGGLASAMHGPDELAATVAALRASVKLLRADGLI